MKDTTTGCRTRRGHIKAPVSLLSTAVAQLRTSTRQSKNGGFSVALRGYSGGAYRGQFPEAAATLGKAHAAASRPAPSRPAPSPGLWLRRQSSSNTAHRSGHRHRVNSPGAAPHRQRWQSMVVVSLLLIGRHRRGLNNSGKEYPLNHPSGLGRGLLCTRHKSKR